MTPPLARRRTSAAVLAVMAVVAWLTFIGHNEPAHGAASVTPTRLAGDDRYATAATIAAAIKFPSGKGTFAVLARGDAFPDALVAAGLAGSGSQGMILLTTGNTLSQSAASALTGMNVPAVVILGGTGAISTNVETQLEQLGYSESGQHPTLSRIGGADRYETAAKAAQAMFANGPIGTVGSKPTAIIATGQNFPDALAAGPAAYVGHFPILLTPTTSLSQQTKQELTNLGVTNVLLAGGTAAISDAVATQISGMGISVDRIAGADRQDTAQKLAQWELGSPLAFDPTAIDLARGDAFPDGLAGAPYAGQSGKGAPVLLTADPTRLGTETSSYIKSHNAPLTSVTAFGGPAAIAQSVLGEATGEATCTPTGSTTTSTSSGVTSTTVGTTSSTTATSTTVATSTSSTSTTTGGPTTTTGPSAPCSSGTTFTTSGGSTTSSGPTSTSTSTSTTAAASGPSITNADSGPGATINVTYNEDVTCGSDAHNDFLWEQDGSNDQSAQTPTACAAGSSGNILTLTFSPGVFAAFPGTTKLVYNAPTSPTTTNSVYAGTTSSPIYAPSQTHQY